MRVYILPILLLLLGSCLKFGNAFFFKAPKGHKEGGAAGYGGYNYGHGGYATSYGYNSNGGYNAGYYGYGNGYNYPQRPHRTKNRARTGRTYSEIARVLRPDPYLGLGAARFVPGAPFAPLWG